MEWITANLRDSATIYENFLDERQRIIVEMQKVHNKLKRNLPNDEKLILQILMQSLIKQMQELERTTEEKFAEIRQRRR